MVLNTITVGAAVTPAVIKTCTSHYLDRKPRRQRPTAHISYDEGLNLIRSFLRFASLHTVEEIQAFTSQWVPTPRWVRVEELTIPQKSIKDAADAITAQLGHKGVDHVGGSTWWRWRKDGTPLKAEWIEMRRDYQRRKHRGDPGTRVMLYVHGGAFFFGSVDEHRYQMQRHARKLQARVFAPRYRLAPQYPFPCGLHDCLAAYLFLLTVQDSSTILLAGDSAGAGMVISMLVTLRDQGIPLPAGAILVSPWVDLTHSFPSVAGDNSLDYIPAHGFLQRPSAAWPPPTSDDIEDIAMHAIEQVAGQAMPRKSSQLDRKKAAQVAAQGFSVEIHPKHLDPEGNPDNPAGLEGAGSRPGNTIPGPGHDLSIMLDGKLIEIKDQIQLYTTNQLIGHPLVSPVTQPSLGGLPPLLVMTGGGEVLRDEQIYIAHKAANPSKYPPGEAYLNEYMHAREDLEKWKPTDVQLQVWDDLCHVAPTLSFTRPAKHMYRSVAQFGAWALARAQKTNIEIADDDEVSVISDDTDTESDGSSDVRKPRQQDQSEEDRKLVGSATDTKQVGKAGDNLPPFRNHMIRQRVDRHGRIFPLGPPSSLPALQMSANEIGVIKPGPVAKWLEAKKQWDKKFSHEKRKVQKQRTKEMAAGYQGFGDDEAPPPSALAGKRGLTMPKEKKRHKSWGMSLWSLWGSSHDEKTIEREEKADKNPESSGATPVDDGNTKPVNGSTSNAMSRSRSRRRNVSDLGQTDAHNDDIDADMPTAQLLQRRGEQDTTFATPNDPRLLSPSFIPLHNTPTVENDGDTVALTRSTSGKVRPQKGGVAFPFSLGRTAEDANASTLTLTSREGSMMQSPGRDGIATESVKGEDFDLLKVAYGEVPGVADIHGNVSLLGDRETRAGNQEPVGSSRETPTIPVQKGSGLAHRQLVGNEVSDIVHDDNKRYSLSPGKNLEKPEPNPERLNREPSTIPPSNRSIPTPEKLENVDLLQVAYGEVRGFVAPDGSVYKFSRGPVERKGSETALKDSIAPATKEGTYARVLKDGARTEDVDLLKVAYGEVKEGVDTDGKLVTPIKHTVKTTNPESDRLPTSSGEEPEEKPPAKEPVDLLKVAYGEIKGEVDLDGKLIRPTKTAIEAKRPEIERFVTAQEF